MLENKLLEIILTNYTCVDFFLKHKNSFSNLKRNICTTEGQGGIIFTFYGIINDFLI